LPARIDSRADAAAATAGSGDESARARVLVAARNEQARIGATIAAVQRSLPGAEVWVADDASRDATAQIARMMGARVVSAPHPCGKGAAMSNAARAALASARGEAAERCARVPFVLCDGDLGDSARELGALAQAVVCGQADLTVGAFAQRSGGGFGLALAFARFAIRSRCGLRTRAPISGQRAIAAGALEALLPFASGYGMEIGMTIDAVRAGLTVREIDLELAHRVTRRTPRGFAHRAAQLRDFVCAYHARSPRASGIA